MAAEDRGVGEEASALDGCRGQRCGVGSEGSRWRQRTDLGVGEEASALDCCRGQRCGGRKRVLTIAAEDRGVGEEASALDGCRGQMHGGGDLEVSDGNWTKCATDDWRMNAGKRNNS